jgi:succinate dehydrogenase/fumarate reductase cytochrome b subunit
MPSRNTVVRSMHDVGVAAWFGGTLMGVVGLNGATAKAKSSSEGLHLASVGWWRFFPVELAAIIAHGIGGIGLILSNKERLKNQEESRTNTVVKSAVTFAAIGTSVASGILGKVIDNNSEEGAEGITEPKPDASEGLKTAQRIQKVLQWVTPALTLVIIVLGAQQGEQQRPIKGLFETTAKMFRRGNFS